MYVYRVRQDPPEILQRGTYAAAYEIPTGGTIVLACHNSLGRNNPVNVFLMPHFMMRESGWEVRDVALHHCPDYRDPNQHCLIITTLREQSDIKLDIELLNT